MLLLLLLLLLLLEEEEEEGAGLLLPGLSRRGDLNQGPRVIERGPVADATADEWNSGRLERRRAVINTGEAGQKRKKDAGQDRTASGERGEKL